MQNTYLLLLVCCFLMGCGPEETDLEAAKKAWSQVQLNCESLSDDEGLPRYAVYAMLQENKVKLAEVSACDTVLPDDFAIKGIPANALTAVGGFWAGYQEYIYAIIEQEELRLFIGGMGEGEDHDKPQYTPLATYDNDRFKLLRPLHPADLAGYYMHQGKDTSYVLFLGLKGPNLVSKIFATADPMPAQKVLQRALPEFASSPDMDFNCNLNGLDFDSGLGNGHIYWQRDSATVTFHQFMGKDKDIVFELMTY